MARWIIAIQVKRGDLWRFTGDTGSTADQAWRAWVTHKVMAQIDDNYYAIQAEDLDAKDD